MGAVELIQEYRPNLTIAEALIKADYYLNGRGYQNIVASISGGADSDVVMDICERLKPHGVHYIWFDTGLEYQATKDHLVDLEKKYGIEIERIKAKVPIPKSNREYGQPFLSKAISEQIMQLQRYNYDWIDRPYEEFTEKYPKAKHSGKWLYNKYTREGFTPSMFDVDRTKHLREFLFLNPPNFKISAKCCNGAKKDVSKDYIKTHDVDMMLLGLRKAEGGVRATHYESCFSENLHGIAQFRPVWWLTQEDRDEYIQLFGVENSRCYTEWGFKRTGCVGCPFGRMDVFPELEIIKRYEPKLYKLACAVFGDSYEYTRQFYEFRERKGQLDGQLSFFDMTE